MEAGMVVVDVLLGILGAGAVATAMGLRVIRQYERGVVFRLGRVHRDVRGAGLTRIVPLVDRLRKVNMQIVTMPVPAQEGITRDNVTVRVEEVV
jgi:regulator of protease activity HflC (stomatin/prohibitin superfamily)